jgi:hypothetical protein
MSHFLKRQMAADIWPALRQKRNNALVADFHGIFRQGRTRPGHPPGSACRRLNRATTACDAVARLVDVNGRVTPKGRSAYADAFD